MDHVPRGGKERDRIWIWTLSDRTRAGTIFLYLSNVRKRNFIGICAPNSAKWVLSDLACLLFDFVGASMHYTASVEDLCYFAAHSEIKCLITSIGKWTLITLSINRKPPKLAPTKSPSLEGCHSSQRR